MRFLISLFVLLFMPLFAFSEVIPEKIYAVTTKRININTVKIDEPIDLYVLKTGTFSNDLNLQHGDKIQVRIISYVMPKRGKRNGYFKVKYNNGVSQMKGTMSASSPKDIKEIAQSASVSVAGTILKVPGFSQAVALSKGLIKPNENETRLESAGKNLYNSTPLKYIETGENFDVTEDGVVVLKLKSEE